MRGQIVHHDSMIAPDSWEEYLFQIRKEHFAGGGHLDSMAATQLKTGTAPGNVRLGLDPGGTASCMRPSPTVGSRLRADPAHLPRALCRWMGCRIIACK